MSPINIIIASVLKPLKDPRGYYRFGRSLRETNKYKINIIGFSTKNEAKEENIKFTPIFSNNRKSFSRLLSSVKLLSEIKTSKPEILIISTWELLPAAILGSLVYGGKIVYDVQENYTLNLTYNQSLKGWKKVLAKNSVAVIEKASKRFIKHYIFSEQCYINELKSFRPFTVFENKFYDGVQARLHVKFEENQPIHFLISGTITPMYGILEGLNWFLEIYKHQPASTLTIIGHITLPEYHLQLKQAIGNHPGIQLGISEFPVDYTEVIQAYESCDMVLMPYRQVPSIKDKIPSKFFESIALGKPALFSPNKQWETMMSAYPAGSSINFEDLPNAYSNLMQALSKTYFNQLPGEEVLWSGEQEKFLQLIGSLSSSK